MKISNGILCVLLAGSISAIGWTGAQLWQLNARVARIEAKLGLPVAGSNTQPAIARERDK